MPKDLDILCLFSAKTWVSDCICDLLSSDGAENGWCFPDIMYSYFLECVTYTRGHERAAVDAVCSQRILEKGELTQGRRGSTFSSFYDRQFLMRANVLHAGEMKTSRGRFSVTAAVLLLV